MSYCIPLCPKRVVVVVLSSYFITASLVVSQSSKVQLKCPVVGEFVSSCIPVKVFFTLSPFSTFKHYSLFFQPLNVDLTKHVSDPLTHMLWTVSVPVVLVFSNQCLCLTAC